MPLLLGNVGRLGPCGRLQTAARTRRPNKRLGAPARQRAIDRVAPQGTPALAWLADEPEVVGDPASARSRGAVAARIAARPPAEVETARTLTRTARRRRGAARDRRALSAERDISKLQRLIVRKARELTRADAGSLFVVEEHDGRASAALRGRADRPQDDGMLMDALLPLSRVDRRLRRGHRRGRAHRRRLRDPRVVAVPLQPALRRPERLSHQIDARACRCATTTATIVGAIQLINRKPSFELVLESPAHTEEVVAPFTTHDEARAALAGLASRGRDGKRTRWSTRSKTSSSSSSAPRSRRSKFATSRRKATPRVAELTVAQADAINDDRSGPARRAALHDERCARCATPRCCTTSAKSPSPNTSSAKPRNCPTAGSTRSACASCSRSTRRVGEDDARAAARVAGQSSKRANEPNVVGEHGRRRRCSRAMARRYAILGRPAPAARTHEYEYLTIPRGSLSNDERNRMQQHVTQSFLFLREIPWARNALARRRRTWPTATTSISTAPAIRAGSRARDRAASAHDDDHRRLRRAHRHDRPYKNGMPVERALDILSKEFAQRGKVDPILLDVFIHKRLYEVTNREDETPDQTRFVISSSEGVYMSLRSSQQFQLLHSFSQPVAGRSRLRPRQPSRSPRSPCQRRNFRPASHCRPASSRTSSPQAASRPAARPSARSPTTACGPRSPTHRRHRLLPTALR